MFNCFLARFVSVQVSIIKHVTSNIYTRIYRETDTRALISVNNCLQDVLELAQIIGLITFFCILNIVLLELSSLPPSPLNSI